MFSFFKRKTKVKSTCATVEDLKVGMIVSHMKFGEGEIIDINEKDVAEIKFIDGQKRILLSYAKLIIVK